MTLKRLMMIVLACTTLFTRCCNYPVARCRCALTCSEHTWYVVTVPDVPCSMLATDKELTNAVKIMQSVQIPPIHIEQWHERRGPITVSATHTVKSECVQSVESSEVPNSKTVERLEISTVAHHLRGRKGLRKGQDRNDVFKNQKHSRVQRISSSDDLTGVSSVCVCVCCCCSQDQVTLVNEWWRWPRLWCSE